MISKYYEFLLEQSLAMINESQIVYSKKFKNLLTKIESPISKFLIEVEDKDVETSANFFDISDNKDTISFISDKRAKEIMGNKKSVTYGDGSTLTHNMEANGEIFKSLGFIPSGSEHYTPEGGERGEIISKTISTTSGKTYLYVKFENGDCVINENYINYAGYDEIWAGKRQIIRTGRGVRSILSAAKQKFSDVEIEVFVNKYKAAYDRMNDVFNNFELVSGNDIAYWYNMKNYVDGEDGTLGNSCMARVPEKFFKIYTENPEVCSLLILKSESDSTKIKGRVLIWKLGSPEITFMDRIYTHDDSDIQLFRDYAKFKNWHYKESNNSGTEASSVSPNGDTIDHGILSVNLKSIKYDSFPYVDTLRYLDDSGKLSTDDSGDCKVLEDTDGGYMGNEGNDEGCDRCGGDGRIECPDCDGDGSDDCDDCDGKGEESCDDCDGTGEDNCSTCDGKGTDINKPDGKCSDCGGTGKDDCINCDGSGEMDCSKCDGSGKIDCNRCDGDGRIDCPECNGW